MNIINFLFHPLKLLIARFAGPYPGGVQVSSVEPPFKIFIVLAIGVDRVRPVCSDHLWDIKKVVFVGEVIEVIINFWDPTK